MTKIRLSPLYFSWGANKSPKLADLHMAKELLAQKYTIISTKNPDNLGGVRMGKGNGHFPKKLKMNNESIGQLRIRAY